MSDWSVELVNSTDLTRIGDLTQARGRQLTVTLNRAGSFGFNLPLDHVQTALIQEVTTGVVLSFLGEPVWSGMVWTCNESVGENEASLAVGCIGWLQTLDKRVVRPSWNNNQPMVYQSTDAGAIALDMLRRTNDDASYAGAPSYVFPGTAEASQSRSRTYQVWSGVLQSITELTEIEAGFDLSVDPITRQMDIYAKKQNDPGIFYELGTNVQSVQRQTDAGRIINYSTAYSSVGAATVAEPRAMYLGLFEEAQSLADIVNPTHLAAFAASEAYVKAFPLPLVNFVPMPYSDLQPGMPRPFRDFDVGDIVYITAKHGRMQVERLAVRVFSMTVRIDDNGHEQVSQIQSRAAS